MLGLVETRRDGRPVDLRGTKPRALVAALALSGGRPVAVDTLIDLLWGDDQPAGVTTTLHAYVSGLRKALEPERAARAPASILVTAAPGYALRIPDDALDVVRFGRLVDGTHRSLSGPLLGQAHDQGTLTAATERLDEALSLWRGTPYAELGDAPAAVADRARLEELRLVAREDRAVARLALGEHAAVAAELEQATAAHPLRERLWALLALALVRSGRQAEALGALRTVRGVLADELGLDPGSELQDLQSRILAQDPALAWSPPDEADVAQPRERSPRDARREVDDAGPERPDGEGRARWPLVGRAAERDRLVAALEDARSGVARFAVLTGEPGIGKSRLCAEVAEVAAARGVRVVEGRCSQDDGAPPLYPWRSVLTSLGAPPDVFPTAEGGEFEAWQRLVAAVVAAARDEPLVLVLDDLHWADTATLRVLRLLVETRPDACLLVICTWRDHPEPTGALADVAEAMARAHAERLELRGLDDAAAAGIVTALTRQQPSDAASAALRERTSGNPFFLVEYARLAGQGRDLGDLLAEQNPPTVVQEVVARRVDRLPEQTRRVVEIASVVGRQVELSVLAECTAEHEDALYDLLDPALASGLVRELGVDRFAFDHALVRDTLYSRLRPSRRARLHAAVATTLARRTGTETETARHWLAAGPAHAAPAWRAAAAAGEVAMRSHAHPEAAALFAQALTSLERDAQAGPRDRYDVLMRQAVADRWAARWRRLAVTAQEAVDLAEELGDPVLAAEAATLTLRGALWQSAAHGQVHERLVASLQRSLQELPDEDSSIRCRCLVALAAELYYVAGNDERHALVAESLAMARRIGDKALLTDVLLSGFTAIWVPGTEEERLAFAEEALGLARELGDAHAAVIAAVEAAEVYGELGRPREMWQRHDEALAGAEPLRLTYALIVLHSMVLPWHAMAGEFEECDRLLGVAVSLLEESELSHGQDAIGGNVAALAMWREGFDLPEAIVQGLDESSLPTDAVVPYLLWRDGQHDRARQRMQERRPVLSTQLWYSKLGWGAAAAMAAYVEDARLGAEAYALLAPYAGQSCSAGSGVASGPIDAYLALAALATGDRESATRHADDADRLAQAWRIPLFGRWFAEQRDRYHF